jgi:hypothetical protein
MEALRDPRVRAFGAIVAVAGLALWIDHESLRGVQQGLEMRERMEAEKERERRAKGRFLMVGMGDMPPAYPWRVDWRRDLAFVELDGRVYYARGGRYVYDWFRRYSDWHRYVVLDRFPDWRDYL